MATARMKPQGPVLMADLVSTYFWPTLEMLGHIALIVGVILLSVAYLTYAERKVLRRGSTAAGSGGGGAFWSAATDCRRP
jgi:NADH:ubiquinone oxidoreductase subunit 1 (chain H)